MRGLAYAAEGPASQARQTTLNLVFRLGLASVFLVNGLSALLEPAPFTLLLAHEPVAQLTRLIGLGPLLALIAVNDLALGLLILTGRRSAYVLAWAGGWLLAVTLVKAFSLA